MATLERVSLAIEPSQEDLVIVAKQVAAKLGYKVLQNKLRIGTLGEALRELDIQPFTRASVEAYKAEKLAEVNRWWKWEPWQYRWHDINIDNYTLPIPIYVLRKALQIKEKFGGGVAFSVHAMMQNWEAATMLPDPFLVVEFSRERFFVEVWDEPAFESKL